MQAEEYPHLTTMSFLAENRQAVCRYARIMEGGGWCLALEEEPLQVNRHFNLAGAGITELSRALS